MQSGINFKTPYYQYDLDVLLQTLSEALHWSGAYGYKVHYALKANNNPVISQLISNKGLGADCVSGNELLEAIHRGFSTDKIVFAGVGKSDEDIEMALNHEIFCINCESYEELEVISQIAERMQKKAPVALRVNPGVAANTHKYITTGLEENKFGIPVSLLQQALDFCRRSPWIEFRGLHFHIGSQIQSMGPYIELSHKVNRIWKKYGISQMGGHVLNLGGGLGIDYKNPEVNSIPPFKEFFGVFKDHLDVPQNVQVHFELGRSLVGQCGKLITKVLYVKKGVQKNFVIADAGMTELMRPALYQANHKIENLTQATKSATEIYDVAGPVCESSDVFGQDVRLPATRRGDLLAIHSCGAYGESMMLRYNMRDKVRAHFSCKQEKKQKFAMSGSSGQNI